MTEQLTQQPEQQIEHQLAVGDEVLVLRDDGRIDSMAIWDISKPVDTFDAHNQPIREREVTVVGHKPEMVKGRLAFPKKTVLEETLSVEAQQKLAAERDPYERSEVVTRRLGELGLGDDLAQDVSVYQPPNMEGKQ